MELIVVAGIAIFFFGRKQMAEWMRNLKLMKYQWDKPLTDEEKKQADAAVTKAS